MDTHGHRMLAKSRADDHMLLSPLKMAAAERRQQMKLR